MAVCLIKQNTSDNWISLCYQYTTTTMHLIFPSNLYVFSSYFFADVSLKVDVSCQRVNLVHIIIGMAVARERKTNYHWPAFRTIYTIKKGGVAMKQIVARQAN